MKVQNNSWISLSYSVEGKYARKLANINALESALDVIA